jgi:hypothetical protein
MRIGVDGMNAHKWSRRTFYLAAAVAIVASTSGFALASVLSPPIQTNQGASYYQGGNIGANGYSTANLTISATPVGVTQCSAGPVTDPSLGSVNLILSSTEGGSCAAGNYAELFTLPFSATISQQTNNFTIYSQVTGDPVQSNSVLLTVGPGGVPHPFLTEVNVYIDYGSAIPPPGISVLDLIVH